MTEIKNPVPNELIDKVHRLSKAYEELLCLVDEINELNSELGINKGTVKAVIE